MHLIYKLLRKIFLLFLFLYYMINPASAAVSGHWSLSDSEVASILSAIKIDVNSDNISVSLDNFPVLHPSFSSNNYASPFFNPVDVGGSSYFIDYRYHKGDGVLADSDKTCIIGLKFKLSKQNAPLILDSLSLSRDDYFDIPNAERFDRVSHSYSSLISSEGSTMSYYCSSVSDLDKVRSDAMAYLKNLIGVVSLQMKEVSCDVCSEYKTIYNLKCDSKDISSVGYSAIPPVCTSNLKRDGDKCYANTYSGPEFPDIDSDAFYVYIKTGGLEVDTENRSAFNSAQEADNCLFDSSAKPYYCGDIFLKKFIEHCKTTLAFNKDDGSAVMNDNISVKSREHLSDACGDDFSGDVFSVPSHLLQSYGSVSETIEKALYCSFTKKESIDAFNDLSPEKKGYYEDNAGDFGNGLYDVIKRTEDALIHSDPSKANPSFGGKFNGGTLSDYLSGKSPDSPAHDNYSHPGVVPEGTVDIPPSDDEKNDNVLSESICIEAALKDYDLMAYVECQSHHFEYDSLKDGNFGRITAFFTARLVDISKHASKDFLDALGLPSRSSFSMPDFSVHSEIGGVPFVFNPFPPSSNDGIIKFLNIIRAILLFSSTVSALYIVFSNALGNCGGNE